MSRVIPGTPLLQAVREYKKGATARLEPERLLTVLQLIKDLNALVPGADLLKATDSELITALGALARKGLNAADLNLLQEELFAFYDAAMDAGLTALHPLRGTARIQSAETVQEAASGEESALGASMGAVTEYLANILQDGVQKGLMLSPLAQSAAALQEEGDRLEPYWNLLPRRWFRFLHRFPWVPDSLRVGILIASLILALAAWFGPDNPFMGAHREAAATGSAIKKLQIAMNLMINFSPGQLDGISSLSALGQQVGIPLEEEEALFSLLRVNSRAPILYLRHTPTQALVVLSPQTVDSYRDGRWTKRDL